MPRLWNMHKYWVNDKQITIHDSDTRMHFLFIWFIYVCKLDHAVCVQLSMF